MTRFLLAVALLSFVQDKPAKAPAALTQDKIEASIKSSLGWLLRHQSENGSWQPDDHKKKCAKPGDCVTEMANTRGATALTAYALWALACGGLTAETSDAPDGIPAGPAIKKATEWLLKDQQATGQLGGHSTHAMENHFIAMIALAHAAGATPPNEIWEVLSKAQKYALDGQNDGAGWRYSPKCGDNDSFITGLGVLAVRAAETVGVEATPKTYLDALAWLDSCTDKDGVVGWTMKGSGKLVDMSRKDSALFEHHQTFTAEALAAQMLCAMKKDDPKAKLHAAVLMKDLPNADKYTNVDYWYWTCGAIALRLWSGDTGKEWKSWKVALQHALVPYQKAKPADCNRGSWDPTEKTGHHGGRVFVTAQAAVMLAMTLDHKATKWEPMAKPPRKK